MMEETSGPYTARDLQVGRFCAAVLWAASLLLAAALAQWAGGPNWS